MPEGSENRGRASRVCAGFQGAFLNKFFNLTDKRRVKYKVKIRVTSTSGKAGKYSFNLLEGVQFPLGRETDEIKLDFPSVSGTHCYLVVEEGVLYIQDAGSKNGTYLNNEKVKKDPIRVGDIVQIGEASIEILKAPKAPEQAPAETKFIDITGKDLENLTNTKNIGKVKTGSLSAVPIEDKSEEKSEAKIQDNEPEREEETSAEQPEEKSEEVSEEKPDEKEQSGLVPEEILETSDGQIDVEAEKTYSGAALEEKSTDLLPEDDAVEEIERIPTRFSEESKAHPEFESSLESLANASKLEEENKDREETDEKEEADMQEESEPTRSDIPVAAARENTNTAVSENTQTKSKAAPHPKKKKTDEEATRVMSAEEAKAIQGLTQSNTVNIKELAASGAVGQAEKTLTRVRMTKGPITSVLLLAVSSVAVGFFKGAGADPTNLVLTAAAFFVLGGILAFVLNMFRGFVEAEGDFSSILNFISKFSLIAIPFGLVYSRFPSWSTALAVIFAVLFIVRFVGRFSALPERVFLVVLVVGGSFWGAHFMVSGDVPNLPEIPGGTDFRDQISKGLVNKLKEVAKGNVPDEKLKSPTPKTKPVGKAPDLLNVKRFFAAVKENDIETVQELVEKSRIDPDVSAKDGNTALMAASFNGSLEIVQYLIKKKADINAKDMNGTTPLMWASYEGHKRVIIFLLENGADTSLKKKDGDTAIGIAKQWGHDDVVKLIENYNKRAPAKEKESSGQKDTPKDPEPKKAKAKPKAEPKKAVKKSKPKPKVTRRSPPKRTPAKVKPKPRPKKRYVPPKRTVRKPSPPRKKAAPTRKRSAPKKAVPKKVKPKPRKKVKKAVPEIQKVVKKKKRRFNRRPAAAPPPPLPPPESNEIAPPPPLPKVKKRRPAPRKDDDEDVIPPI